MGMAKSREWNFLGTIADPVARVVIAKQVQTANDDPGCGMDVCVRYTFD